MMRRLLAGAIVLAALMRPASADLAAGVSSFERGDYAASQELLRPLAEQGDPRAQYVLGIIYLNDFVTPPGEDTALAWIRRAAEQDYLPAQSELARMYRTGHGVPQDFREMLRWYSRAAQQGDVGAQLFLADSYAYGYGTEPDYVHAYMWYEIAIRYWGPLAVRARDVIAEKMTPEQITQAVDLATDWVKASGR